MKRNPTICGPRRSRDGLGWLLWVWLGMAALGACKAQTDGQRLLEERLEGLEPCPQATCPAPICPACPTCAGAPSAPPASGEPSAGRAEPPTQASGPAPGADKVDLNQASAEEALEKLPGVGPSTAQKIMEYRQSRPFRSPRDLLRVKGIGPAKLRKIEPFVVAGSKP